MLGYPAKFIGETIALAPGFPVAIRLQLDADGNRRNPRWRRTDIEEWVTTHRKKRAYKTNLTCSSRLSLLRPADTEVNYAWGTKNFP